MRKIILTVLLLASSGMTLAQTCTPGGGVTCSANLNLWLLPQHYIRWDIPMNANSNILDAFSATTLKLPDTSPQTMSGQLILPSLIDTSLGSTTAPVCPNGVGGALTTIGCASVANGFPLVIGDTSIGASSTITTIDGLTLTNATLTTATVNGVTLNAVGSASLFLNQAGSYTTPAGGGTVSEVDTGAGLTGGPITGTGTISIPSAAVTNAMLVNNSMTLDGTVCALGSSCTVVPVEHHRRRRGVSHLPERGEYDGVFGKPYYQRPCLRADVAAFGERNRTHSR